MNDATESRDNRSNHTGIALTVAVALTVVLLIANSALVWKMQQDFGDVADVELKLQRLKGTIIHLDEVLTMSSRLAASTGDERWERRYREYEPLLDRAIKQAIELTPESNNAEAAVQTDAANIKLVSMEHRAFALVRRGQRDKAMAILLSSEYSEQKQVYSRGMERLGANIDQHIASGVGRYRQYLILVVSCAVLGAMTLVGTWLAVLRIIHRETAQRRQAEEALLAAHRDLESRVKERTKELQQSEQLLRRLLDIQEKERQMVAHDIHDGFVQDVVGAKLCLEGIQGDQSADTVKRTLDPVVSLLKKALTEGRRMIRDLRPMILDESGVVEAVKHLIADEMEGAGLTVAFQHEIQFGRLEPTLEGTIFRIVQESLNNVKHHAQTDHAAIQITQENGTLRLVVRDQGVGFDPKQVSPERFGLRGIRERARLVGGKATVESAPGVGTTVQVQLPISSPILGDVL